MPASPLNRQNLLLTGGFVFITVALIVISNGNVAAALVPMVGIIALIAVILLPLRITATVFFTIVILFHSRDAYFSWDVWNAPLASLGPILFENLRHHTGIGALKFNLVELVFGLMLIVIGVRTLMRNNIDHHLDMAAARPMKTAVALTLLAIFLGIAWGKIKGDFNSSEMLWQVRTRFWVPFLLIIAMRAFKTEQDIRRLAIALTVVCVVRIAEGMYLNFMIVIPQGLKIHCLMTHSDTVWFVTLIIVLISSFLERADKKSLIRLVTLGGLVMYGIVINDRRIAFVSLALGLVTILFLVRIEIRRILIRIIAAMLPIIIVYFVLGIYSESSIFAPVHSLVSVTDSQDASNWCRNVENHDLIETLRGNPLLGVGWGHGYNDVLTEVKFTDFAFRYHPHNSMLGLLVFSGAIGFFLTWIYLPIGVFLARRAYLRASTPLQRTTAMTAVCTVITFMIQSYGDMGAKDIKTAIILCTVLGCTANLASRLDAN